MSDLEIHEEFFPFDCSNDNCKKCYGLEVFLYIANRFGFIFLSNDEYNLFGFTCPECKTTTVRKYILNTNVPNISSIEQFSHFIPFCSDKDKIVELFEHDSRCNLFHLPQQITLLYSESVFGKISWYTDSFLKKCLLSFCEKDIGSILAYENLNKKCLFPRIISEHSVYVFTEEFMRYVADEGYLFDNVDIDNMEMDYGIGIVYADDPSDFTANMERIADRFLYPSRNSNCSFTLEEYQDLTMKYMSWNNFPPKFDTKTVFLFLHEYKEKRNDFDFQETCISGLFYKYIKSLYYSKGYFRSKLYFEHKVEYERLFGKEFKSEIKHMMNVDDPYNHEILTANDVADRWGRDANILKSLILKMELPAYHYNGVWLEIETPENMNREIDLQNYIFLKSEVEQLEVLTPSLNLKNQGKKDELKVEQPVQKQRISTVVNIECQKKAKELWDIAEQKGERDLSTGAMANHPDIIKIGGNYTKAKRQRWISEVAPDWAKKPGVRSNKN